MTNPARTKAEAILGISYRIRLHELHCRFYRRARGAVMLFSFAAGSAAITTAVQTIPGAIAALAALVAVLAYIEGATNLAALAERHSMWAREFNRYLARAIMLSDIDAIDAGRIELIAETTVDIQSLCGVAYNDALRSSGYEDGIRPEVGVQRFMRALA